MVSLMVLCGDDIDACRTDLPASTAKQHSAAAYGMLSAYADQEHGTVLPSVHSCWHELLGSNARVQATILPGLPFLQV